MDAGYRKATSLGNIVGQRRWAVLLKIPLTKEVAHLLKEPLGGELDFDPLYTESTGIGVGAGCSKATSLGGAAQESPNKRGGRKPTKGQVRRGIRFRPCEH